MAIYTDYEPVPDDNGSGSVPTRFPEGNFKGTWVNLCFRHMAAVIRDLGDHAAKLPIVDGEPVVPHGGRIGTLAFQNANNVEITGGFFRGRGYVFVGALMDFDGTWAEYLEVYDELFTRGWVVCDGRTVRNPYTNAFVTLPDYRGRYRRMFASTAAAGVKFGADEQRSSESGARDAGTTGGTALTAANLPIARSTAEVALLDDEDTIGTVVSQTATAHTHTVPAIPVHTHVVDMLPLSVNVITLKRVW